MRMVDEERKIKRSEFRKEFRIWANTQLIHKCITKAHMAKELGVPLPRICEAINGKGGCVKYIPMILRYLGGDEERYLELYGEEDDTKEGAV